MGDPLRIGLVGVGSISQIAHLPVLAKETRVELVGICDMDLEKAERLAQNQGIAFATKRISELIPKTACEAVIISTPTRFHAPLTLRALEHGVHVFLEMPPLMTAKEAESIRAAALKANRIVAMIRHRRFRDDSQTLRRLVDGGELGKLQYILMRYHFSRGWLHSSWRGQVSLSGGGILMDQGVQLLDFGRYITGEKQIRSVSAAIFPVEGPADLEEAALVLFRFHGGVVLAMEFGPWLGAGEPGGLKLQVFGSGGTATLPGLQIHKELYGSPVTVVPRISTPERDLYQQSYRDALLSLVTGVIENPEAMRNEMDDLVALMSVSGAVYQSAREGNEHILS